MNQYSTRAGLALLVVLLLGAFGLRIWDLNEASVWHDEAWSIRAIRDPIDTPDDNTPPVYYSLLHLAYQGSGETPFAFRFGSVLLDLLTLALAARVMRRWAGWGAALLATLLLAVSPLLWAYAREVRAYVVVPLLTLVILWLVDRLLQARVRFPWRRWGALLVAELILLYTHNLSVPVVVWLNLTVGAAWTLARRWRFLGLWIGGQVATLLAYLPWLAGQSPSGTALNTPPEVSLGLVWDIWQAYFAPVPAQLGAENALVLGSAVFGVVTLGSIAAALVWRRGRRTYLLLSQAVLLPALATAELIAANIDFHPRYYIAGVPATLLLVAWGVDSLPDRLDARRLACPLVMAAALGVAAASLTGLLGGSSYRHDDFRAMAAYYADLPPDAIIVIPYGGEPALEEYYVEKMDIQAEILDIDLHSSPQAAMQAINAALVERDGPVRVELLTWYQLPADRRGMYPCLLESAGQRGSTYTVQGLSTQAYTLARPLALDGTPLVTTAQYDDLALRGVAFGGGQSICLWTQWAAPAATGHDWHVAARIPTPVSPAWYVTSSDADVRADDQRPTSEWDRGDQGDAFNLLRLPDGTPPGAYPLYAWLYSDAILYGVGPSQVAGSPCTDRTLTVATVQPEHLTQVTDPPDPPHPVEVALGPDVTLAGYAGGGDTLNPGQELRVTLYWHSQVAGEPGMVTLRGDGWAQSQPVRTYPVYNLDWHAFRVPADAAGTAQLTVESDALEPVALAAYNIAATEHLFALPAFDTPVNTVFPGVAELVGVSVNDTTLTTDQTLRLTLVWRVLETPTRPLTVFTHLLNDSGQQIGGHDGVPAINGEPRPATSWVPDEYILDTHVLTFEAEDQGYSGPARLEIGLYDSQTIERQRTAAGADHVILPLEITVQ
jgi:hypothetical protein